MYKMNSGLDHPLMYVKSLDEPPNRSRGSLRGSRKKGRARSLPAFKHNEPKASTTRVQSADTLTMQTRYRKHLLDEVYHIKDPVLSESESESEESQEEQTGNHEAIPVASEKDLLDEDLYLSSDSDESSSEVTGPSSDEDSDGSAEVADKLEYLCQRQKGTCSTDQAYFFVKKNPGVSVYEDLKKIPLSADPETVLAKFRLFCRDYPVEKAGIIFAGKLKATSFKKCLKLVSVYQPLFEALVFKEESSVVDVFGRIVMTLIFYWHRENMAVAGKLLRLMSSWSKPVDPLSLRPYLEEDHSFPSQRSALKDSNVAYVCCETYFMIGDVEHCLELLVKALTDTSALNVMKPLIKRAFSEWTLKRKASGLMTLFMHVLRIQRNGEVPIDLSAVYDGVLSVHVVSKEKDDLRRALELFDLVRGTYYFQPAAIPCRGLLIRAATIREPRARIHRIFGTCLKQGAYPFCDFENLTIKILSSMTKIEIQIYLEVYVRGFMKLVWAQAVALKPFLKFEFEVVSSAPLRDYVHPVFHKIRQVDHSGEAAHQRLCSVIHHYLKVPPDLVLRSYGNSVLLLDKVVLGLFKKVLGVDSLEEHRPGPGCPFCKFVRPDKPNLCTGA